MQPEGIICPECNTSNEVGWSFCQQCGKRLPKSPPPPSFGQMPIGLKTVPEPRAQVETNIEHSLKTVPERTSVDEYETKVATEQSFSTEPEPFRPPEPSVEPPSPTAVVDSPPARTEASTVLIDTPPERIAVSPPPQEEHLPEPPQAPAPIAWTEHVPSVSGVLCTQCGQASSVGSATCANCGAPIGFGKTQVMTSQPSPTRGRLHLVMEGGQPGEIYQLSDDTVIGRSNGDITFPHDGFMSGRHARIVQRGASFVLTDEGSRNGTFVKIKGEVELKPGDMVLVGKQLFRFEV